MATTSPISAAKPVRGGSFLTEERQPQEIFTPEDLSGEHRQIAKTASDFTNNEVMPAAAEIEAKNFTVTARPAAQGRRTGADGRGRSGGLWRARVGQGDLGADRRIHVQAGQFLGGLQRARGHRHAADGLVRDGGAEAEISAQAGHRRVDRGLCAFGILLRIGRASIAARAQRSRRTASTTCSTARRCGSPTPASPICSPYSPRSMARSSRPF